MGADKEDKFLPMKKPDLSRIPITPGVYLFKNEQDRVLYVGKAKQLRRRLASYFRPEQQLAPKTRSLVQKASALETISTDTDNEAFLLEASLIKKYRPRYNIILRDDKDYVIFRINLEAPYPKLEMLRKAKLGKIRRSTRTFGPFVSGADAKATWKSIHRAFPLRRCTDRNFKNRTKPCLYHHMGQCLGPCVNDISHEDYAAMLGKVIMLLEGKSTELMENLQKEMLSASDNLAFERAALLRDQIQAVEHTVEKQSVVLPVRRDMDVLGLMENDRGLGLGLLAVRSGSLLGSQNYFWSGLGLAEADELLASFLVQYYAEADTIPPLIVLPWLPGGNELFVAVADSADALDTGVTRIAEVSAPMAARVSEEEIPQQLPDGSAEVKPRSEPAETNNDLFEAEEERIDQNALEELFSSIRGSAVRLVCPRDKAETDLVSLASANARDAARQRREDRLPDLLARAFMREEPIARIEVVDVSHTSGAATRAGMVVFEDGLPMKNDWRNYAFEDGGGDDYAILAAWAERRAKAGGPWPDLLLIDGGKGQLSVVDKVFTDKGLNGAFVLASIAKARDEDGHSDRRAGNVSDRIFLPGRSNPLNLKPGSAELLFLQHIRNHAHDFVIGRHRKARSGLALQGELSRIPGFGQTFVRRLWEKFDSLEAMARASDEDLRQIQGMGSSRIKILREHLARVVDKNKPK